MEAIKVEVGRFACEEIQARIGHDVSVGMGAALEHYARRLESRPAPVGFPRFREGARPAAIGARLTVPLPAETARKLKGDAARRGLLAEDVAVHAAFVYLADLDRA